MVQIADMIGVVGAVKFDGGGNAFARAIRSACLACVMLVMTAMGSQVFAQSKAVLEISEKGGFSRLVFTFEILPKFKVNVTDSVLIVSFDEAIDIGEGLRQLRDLKFLVAGRVDPDSKAVRFALARKVRANTIEAGDKLFVDLLPDAWRGPPPSLPQSVISELAARAKKAEEMANRDARLKAAEDKNRIVKVRIGEHPTFSRMSFDWAEPPTAQLTRAGNVITLTFDKLAQPLMGRLKADPPKFVRSADFEQGEEGLVVTLNIDPVMDIRGFREGNSYVLDVSDPFGLSYANDIAKKIGGAVSPRAFRHEPVTEIKADRDLYVKPKEATDPKETKDTKANPGPKANKSDKGSVEPKDTANATMPVADIKPVMKADAAKTDRVQLPKPEVPMTANPKTSPAIRQTQSAQETRLGLEVPTIIISEKPLDHNGFAAVDDKRTASLEKVLPVAVEPVLETEQPAVQDPVVPAGKSDPDIIDVAAKTPAPMAVSDKMPTSMPRVTGTKMSPKRMKLHEFAFSRPVAAAILVRANALWLRFDTQEPVDVGALFKRSPDLFGKPVIVRSGDKQSFRVPLKDDLKIAAWPEGNTWVLGLDENTKGREGAVKLIKGVRTDGLLKVTAKLNNIGTASLYRDPVIGDNIYLATVFGVTPAYSEERLFVEFSTLPTLVGLAIKPNTDDLAVRLVNGELMITRRGGLTLSSGEDGLSSKKTFDEQNGLFTGAFDIADWSAGTGSNIHDRIADLERGIASLPAFQAVGLRMELTHHYLGNRLGAEALGQIRLMVASDPDIADKPVIHAMRAVANSMLHRPEETRKDMKKRDVGTLPTMVLWRAVMEAQSEDWPKAMDAFRIADAEISKYTPDLQVYFRLLFALAAVETGDWVTADLQLKAVPIRFMTPPQAAERVLLRARMLEGLGRSDDALTAYEFATDSHDRKAEAAAILYQTQLEKRLGRIEDDTAIQRYEAASVMWRGDSLELKVLRNLARLYVKKGEFRRGFETMKTAVTNFPRMKLSSKLHEEMHSVFRDLFLDGKADLMAPIKALSLYYDYRELTPVGRLGDEMIRKLADRLINVDLLDKAAEVLAHQVDKRLTGAARAQVAAKLAAVYMLDRKPEKSLEVLRRTRQAILPGELLRKRRLLEARSLSELGRDRQAIDLISNFDGADIDRTRAETYWKNERWQNAGESFELMLSGLENTKAPLTDLQRIDVMKAAIAYSLADDTVGIKRFRQKYAERMANSRDANAFDVLTGLVDKQSVEFQNLAREIASIDSLEGFLSEYRKSLDSLENENGDALPAS